MDARDARCEMSVVKPLVNQDVCWKLSAVDEMALLADAEIYYRAFVRAAQGARRSILLSGWQFDTEMQLLRDKEQLPGKQNTLVGFLNQLCTNNPQLQVHILAWDYSLIYAVEREWMQRVKMALKTHERIHFEYWAHPNVGGSHHHKYALIDDEIAFVGGLDICDSRWDTRAHAPHDERRIDVSGEPYRPFHDLQLALRGEVVADVRRIFEELWSSVSKLPVTAGQPWDEKPSLRKLAEDGLFVRAREVMLSRTIYREDEAGVTEVEALLTQAIASAESFIYIENQYLTSLAILTAFRDRLLDAERPLLTIVVVMPDGGDTPKEDFVLGNRQRSVRYAIAKVAEQRGHRIRFLITSDRSDAEKPVSTFIHAKLLAVDDQLLCVGSANLTNRSMRIDNELVLTVQADAGSDASADIHAVVSSLLAEHAGLDAAARFSDRGQLAETIDALCDSPESKLQHLQVERCDDEDPMLILIFDPSGEVTTDNFGDALQAEVGCEDGIVRTVMRKAGQRLGVIDVD
jgi:phosphatidylserine/phosphatidylglycerophosphate/cardiolipin synthase-like enzyme